MSEDNTDTTTQADSSKKFPTGDFDLRQMEGYTDSVLWAKLFHNQNKLYDDIIKSPGTAADTYLTKSLKESMEVISKLIVVIHNDRRLNRYIPAERAMYARINPIASAMLGMPVFEHPKSEELLIINKAHTASSVALGEVTYGLRAAGFEPIKLPTGGDIALAAKKGTVVFCVDGFIIYRDHSFTGSEPSEAVDKRVADYHFAFVLYGPVQSEKEAKAQLSYIRRTFGSLVDLPTADKRRVRCSPIAAGINRKNEVVVIFISDCNISSLSLPKRGEETVHGYKKINTNLLGHICYNKPMWCMKLKRNVYLTNICTNSLSITQDSQITLAVRVETAASGNIFHTFREKYLKVENHQWSLTKHQLGLDHLILRDTCFAKNFRLR